MLGETCIQINNKKKILDIFVEKRNDEKSISECNKLRTFIESVVERNIKVLKN